jgi:preprotein translocase subunit SecE
MANKKQKTGNKSTAAVDKSAADKVVAASKSDGGTKDGKKNPDTAKPQPKDAKAKDNKAKEAAKAKSAPKKEGVISRIRNYFHNVRLEIKRTTWPTRQEVLNMSMVVVAALLFFGVLIFVIDTVMTQAVVWYSGVPDLIAGGE